MRTSYICTVVIIATIVIPIERQGTWRRIIILILVFASCSKIDGVATSITAWAAVILGRVVDRRLKSPIEPGAVPIMAATENIAVPGPRIYIIYETITITARCLSSRLTCRPRRTFGRAKRWITKKPAVSSSSANNAERQEQEYNPTQLPFDHLASLKVSIRVSPLHLYGRVGRCA